MRPEAEIKAALIHALAGISVVENPNLNDIAAIRALAWVLDIDVSCVRKLPPQKTRKQPVAADHFAI
jgi:hypothetical protein